MLFNAKAVNYGLCDPFIDLGSKVYGIFNKYTVTSNVRDKIRTGGGVENAYVFPVII